MTMTKPIPADYDPSDWMNNKYWTDDYCISKTPTRWAPWYKLLYRDIGAKLGGRWNCLINGHRFHVNYWWNGPTNIYCPSCRRYWRVVDWVP